MYLNHALVVPYDHAGKVFFGDFREAVFPSMARRARWLCR